MSFGFGIGDIIALGTLAWSVYKACRAAPKSFENISGEVLSLHGVLKECEETVFAPPLSPEKQARMRAVGDGCQRVLEDLQSLVEKYQRLGTQTRCTWDRARWHAEDIAELRSRLTSNIVMLNTWISASQANVGKLLNDFIREFREGRFEGSVTSTMTIDSLSEDEKQGWRSIRKSLEEIGITVDAFNENKDFIISWFMDAVTTGAFEEEAPDDESTIELCEEVMTETRDNNQPPQEGSPDPSVARPQMREPRNSQVTRNTGGQQEPTRPQYGTQKHFAGIMAALSRPRSSFITAMNERNFGKARAILNDDAKASMINLAEALYISVRKKNYEMIKLVLKKGCNINAILNLKGETALMIAVRYDNEGIVQLLLQEGCDVNARNRRGDTALSTAVSNDNEQIVRLLLGKDNADVEGTLVAAANIGNEQIVRLLLHKGADINARDNTGDFALYSAANAGHVRTVRLLLEKGADVNARKKGIHDTALSIAEFRKHKQIIGFLLQKGAAVSARNIALLISSAKSGENQLVQMLVENGLDPNTPGPDGEFALHEAIAARNAETVQVLLQKGADVNVCSTDSPATTLDMAIKQMDLNKKQGEHDQKESRRIVEMLVLGGAAISPSNPSNVDLLFSCSKDGNDRMVRAMLQSGMDPNAIGSAGIPVLHSAVRSKNVQLVRLLLENGADTIFQDLYSNETAMDIAEASGNDEMVQLLFEKSAKPSPSNERKEWDEAGTDTVKQRRHRPSRAGLFDTFTARDKARTNTDKQRGPGPSRVGSSGEAETNTDKQRRPGPSRVGSSDEVGTNTDKQRRHRSSRVGSSNEVGINTDKQRRRRLSRVGSSDEVGTNTDKQRRSKSSRVGFSDEAETNTDKQPRPRPPRVGFSDIFM